MATALMCSPQNGHTRSSRFSFAIGQLTNSSWETSQSPPCLDMVSLIRQERSWNLPLVEVFLTLLDAATNTVAESLSTSLRPTWSMLPLETDFWLVAADLRDFSDD